MLLPGPDSLDESFAAHIVPGEVFLFFELLFDDGLRRDAGVVESGDP